MSRRSYLGEFELMVMLALVRLGDNAYGVTISRELEDSTRQVSLGSVYAALERLGQKGYVISTLGDPTPERGGRAKRYFTATPKGIKAVHATRTALTRLWRGVPKLVGRHT